MLCDMQEERGQRRLQFLLKQAEVFQHFAPAASEKEKKCAPCLTAHARPSMHLHVAQRSAIVPESWMERSCKADSNKRATLIHFETASSGARPLTR